MEAFQTVVSDYTEPRDADVDNGDPSFERMVASAVHPVAKSDRGCRASSLERSESSGIVHHIVWQQNLFTPAALHVPGGYVIKSAHRAHPSEQPKVRTVAKPVNRFSDGRFIYYERKDDMGPNKYRKGTNRSRGRFLSRAWMSPETNTK